MAVKDLLKGIGFVFDYFKVNLASQFEYRFSFIFTAISMMLNNLVWIFFWFIIFARFQDINGWVFKDMLIVYAVLSTAFGLTGVFFGNRFVMSRVIEVGGLDFYLALPKNVLLHLLVSRFSVGGFGDLVFGIILSFFALTWQQVPLFILLTLLSFGILMAFAIAVGSLAFLMGRSQSLERTLFMGVLSLGGYPLSIFQGFTKLILLTVIPAGFITGIPVQLLNQFDLKWLLIMIAIAAASLYLSITFFNWCIRRYESGSLIVERM